MNKFHYLFGACIFLHGFFSNSESIAGSICRTNISASTPNSQFINNSNGTVTDKKTGLMWTRCVAGVSGPLCTKGQIESYGWEEALTYASELSFAGYQDWRLPNIKELESIVEQRCHSPAINTHVFTNFPNTSYFTYFWSSTPNEDGEGRSIEMKFGDVEAPFLPSGSHVLVVRNGIYHLTVSKKGTGNGSVNGKGISCGKDCTESIANGTRITLTATPANGSVFAGWSGGCSGKSKCIIRMTSAKSVIATFNRVPAK